MISPLFFGTNKLMIYSHSINQVKVFCLEYAPFNKSGLLARYSLANSIIIVVTNDNLHSIIIFKTQVTLLLSPQ